MKPGQLKWIAILLGAAVLLWLVPTLVRDDGGGGTVEVGTGFTFQVPDSITRIDVIERPSGDTIRLDRGPVGWMVDGHPADARKVADLLDAVDSLHSDILVARNPANHAAMGVVADSGRRIEIYTEAGGPLAFLLGHRDLNAGGWFVRHADADEVYRLEGPAGGYLGRDVAGWRDRTIATVDTAMVREILIRRPPGELVLRRTDAGWRLGEDAVPDTAVVETLLRQLPLLSASGFPTDAEAAAIDFETPDAELDVFVESEGDVTGRQLVMALHLVQDEEAGDWLVRPADSPEVYRLAPFTVRRLLPARETLLGEEPDEDAGGG